MGTQSREGGEGKAGVNQGQLEEAPLRGCGHSEGPSCADIWGTQGRGSRWREASVWMGSTELGVKGGGWIELRLMEKQI